MGIYVILRDPLQCELERSRCQLTVGDCILGDPASSASKSVKLTDIPQVCVGELAIIISYPTSASGIILLKTIKKYC